MKLHIIISINNSVIFWDISSFYMSSSVTNLLQCNTNLMFIVDIAIQVRFISIYQTNSCVSKKIKITYIAFKI